MINVQPVSLQYENISLEPLGVQHEAGLALAAADGKLWEITVTSVPEPDKTLAYIEQALTAQAKGDRLPFVVIDKTTGNILGSTSYHDIVSSTGRLEIGYTWYAKSVQRTRVNSICKLMLMQHAFETLGCALVGWRTDILNFNSQRAIQRLGARREGVIRQQAVRRDGTVRDAVMYGMLASQWPEKKAELLNRLVVQTPTPLPQEVRAESFAVNGHVRLVEIDRRNHLDVIRLDSGALGLEMVATAGNTLAQAQFSPNAWPRAIVAGREGSEMVVGLLMLFDPTLAEQTDEPGDVLYLWRLLIDLKHHGKGYGRAAVKLVQERAVSMPAITSLKLSHSQLPNHPGPFYESLGFTYTGQIEDEELVMVWDVQAERARLASVG